MRTRTTVTLGAVLASTLLTGVGATSAVFSDSETLSAGTVGAGSVALTAVTPNTTPLIVTPAESNAATVAVRGEATGPTELWLAALDGEGYDCPRVSDVTVVVGRAEQPDVRIPLCDLLDEPHIIAHLEGDAPSTQLTLRATGVGASANQHDATAWSGRLRVTLRQDGGGFRDSMDLPTIVAKPAKK